MKNLFKLFVAIVMIAGFTNTLMAQMVAHDHASTTAEILAPLTLTKTADLDFGKLSIVPAGSGGTVVLDPTDGGVDLGTASGAEVFIVPSSGAQAASFDAGGEVSTDYTIALTGAPFDVVNGASDEMVVSALVSSPAEGSATLNGSGHADIAVGATLTLSASQPSGVYTNAAALTCTINY